MNVNNAYFLVTALYITRLMLGNNLIAFYGMTGIYTTAFIGFIMPDAVNKFFFSKEKL